MAVFCNFIKKSDKVAVIFKYLILKTHLFCKELYIFDFLRFLCYNNYMAKRNKTNIGRKPLRFIKATAATLLTAAAVFGVSAFRAQVKNEQLGSNNEIIYNLEALNAQHRYLKNEGSFCRLPSNGKEPIYVSFSYGFNEYLHSAATQALNNLFDALYSINPDYHFKEVSNAELLGRLIEGQAGIYFTIHNGLDDHVAADASSGSTLADLLASSNFSSINVIRIDTKKASLDEDIEQTTATFMHEILHTLGFRDIYDYESSTNRVNPNFGNHFSTIMDPKYELYFSLITPNDYKLLFSLYAPSFKSETEREAFLQTAQQKVKKYEDYYYDAYSKVCLQNIANKEFDGPLSCPNNLTNLEFDKNAYRFNSSTEQFAITKLHHKIEIDGNNYSFSIFDESGKLLDKSTGEIYQTENFLILKDVFLEHGSYSSGANNEPYNGTCEPILISHSGNLFTIYSLSQNQLLRIADLYAEFNQPPASADSTK